MRTLLFFFFILFSVGVLAQTDSLKVKNDKSTIQQKKFNTKNLENYKSSKEFIYEEGTVKAEPSFLERVFNWFIRQLSRLLEWIFGVKYAKGILANILAALPYIIAGIVLFLLFKFFLKVNSNSIIRTAKNKSVVLITEEEELIKTKDILKLIQKAIAQKNYRLAVRYYYINMLKQLEDKHLITWEQQKTNEDYSKEIKHKVIQKSFVNLTRLYDFIWYGNFTINETEFMRVASDFSQITHLIQKK